MRCKFEKTSIGYKWYFSHYFKRTEKITQFVLFNGIEKRFYKFEIECDKSLNLKAVYTPISSLCDNCKNNAECTYKHFRTCSHDASKNKGTVDGGKVVLTIEPLRD